MGTVSPDLLEGSRPKRLVRRQGRWYLEVVRLVSKGDGIFQPRTQRIAGRGAILEALTRSRQAHRLVEATERLLSRGAGDDETSFDCVDGAWLPSTLAASNAPALLDVRTPTEAALSAELTLLRARFEGVVARLTSLERKFEHRLSVESRAVEYVSRVSVRPAAVLPPPKPASIAPVPETTVVATSPPLRVPSLGVLVNTLVQLSGQQIALKEAKDFGPGWGGSARLFASWLIDDEGKVVGGMVCDGELVARLGGALLMLARSEIDAQASAAQPSEEVALSMSEICNNLSGAFNEIPGNPHVRSEPLAPLGERAPEWLPSARTRLACVHPGGGSMVLLGK